jgi:acyl-CoA synthetase (AMP-forming)/AMP-acid ligase II
MPLDVNLRDVLSSGAARRPALLAPDTQLSLNYEQLRGTIDGLAERLAQLGLGPGDRIALALPNGPEAILMFLAAGLTGTAAPLNPGYTEDEFRFYLGDTRAKALVLPAEGGDAARRAAGDTVPVIRIRRANGQGFALEAERPAGAPPPLEAQSLEAPSPEDVALVLHTSGTTSTPKRVPILQRALALSARNIAATYRLSPEDIALCVMPLFHIHGLVASTLATLQSGGQIVVPGGFNVLSLWNQVKSHHATWFSATGAMHQMLLGRAKQRDERHTGHRLRFIRSSSARLPESAMQEMEGYFGVPVLEAYGMTEAAHQMASNPLPPLQRKAGTVGVATGIDLQVVDDQGNPVPTGQIGEVVIRGDTIIKGYENNPDANATAFFGDWFRTGDQGLLDADRYLRLTGRLKELINRGGEKVSPIEVDEVLLTHPAVLEAVTFGRPHPTLGEEVAAAVILKEKVSASELQKHCRERLAKFKVPQGFYFVDAIPRTATGKIQRKKVSEVLAGAESGNSEKVSGSRK